MVGSHTALIIFKRLNLYADDVRWAEGSWVDDCDVKVNLTTTLTLLVFAFFSDTCHFVSSRKHLHLPEAFVFFRFLFFCYLQALFSH